MTYSLLYDFSGRNDGSGPYGNLIFDSAGNIYGTIVTRGTKGYGVVLPVAAPLNVDNVDSSHLPT